MRSIGSEVKEVEEANEVNEGKDEAPRHLSPRRLRMRVGVAGFSFTSCTSFTSLAFTGVCS